MRWRAGLFVVLLVFLIPFGGGCGGPEAASGGEETTGGSERSGGSSLTVFAASSLTDAFEELGDDFAARTGAEVTFNFASSSTLATQLEQGARADVFASADEAQMENVAQVGLLDGDPEVFARNRLVVILPADNPGGVERFGDLADPDLRLVLAQDDVPAAEYAQ